MQSDVEFITEEQRIGPLIRKFSDFGVIIQKLKN